GQFGVAISEISFDSSNGRIAVSSWDGAGNGVLTLLEIPQGRTLAQLTHPSPGVTGEQMVTTSLAPRQPLVGCVQNSTASGSAALLFYSVETQALLRSEVGLFNYIRFSPDGRHLLVNRNLPLRPDIPAIWTLPEFSPIRPL